MNCVTKSNIQAIYKTQNVVFTFFFIFLIFWSKLTFANTEEYMSYDDFLFDAESLLEKNVKVEVPIFSFDIPSRTIDVDLQNLEIDVSKIDRETLKDISVLCNGTGAQCFLHVAGKLVRHPDYYPTYLIAANNATLWFQIGVAVSEEGVVYININ